ncbi:MAG: hypothetical protein U0R17_02800 [Acidimicrobiia bacterium]
MQGVIVSFDPATQNGTVMSDTADRTIYPLSTSALDNSIFNILRQGQRVNFEIDDDSHAINVRIGSEGDMGISTARV